MTDRRKLIPAAALARRLGFVGTTGSGKTYTAKGGVERKLHGKEKVVIIDPLDVWWGLRLSEDGKTPSPYELVIFGGKHGDIPIVENGGKLLGEAIATAKESCIVSLGALRHEAARRRFMVAFLEALYEHTDPERSEPYTVVFDEADMWAPQKPFGGNAEQLLHLMEEIVRRGRVRGFLPWLITQRPSIINKNVLSQVDGLIAMQLTGAHDRGAIGAWIEGHADPKETKELLASLASMQQGHGLLWVPRDGILQTMWFPENATFDSSRTPKRGEKKRTITLKPLNLDRLKGQLASVEADAKINDPTALKKQVADLQAQLRKVKTPLASSSAASKAELAAAEAKGFSQGEIKGTAIAADRWWRAGFGDGWEARRTVDVNLLATVPGNAFNQAFGTALKAATASIRQAVPAPKKSGPPAVTTRTADTPTRAPAIIPPRASTPSLAAGGDGSITAAKQRILDAIAWVASLGNPAVDKSVVAIFADASSRSSSFANNLGALRSAGLIDYPSGGRVQLTAEGEAAAAPPAAAPTHEALMQKLAAKLPSAQMRILTSTASAFPEAFDKEMLAEDVGASSSSSSFANNLGALRTLGLITYPERGKVRADERLFP